MRVQNPRLAGTTLALPFAFDVESRKSVSVVLDERGCADVPDRDGLWLVGTPGWRELAADAPATDAVSADVQRTTSEILAHGDPAYAARIARGMALRAREAGHTADADALDSTAATLEARVPTAPAGAPTTTEAAPSEKTTEPAPADDGTTEIEIEQPTTETSSLADEITALTSKKDALAFGELHEVPLSDTMLLRDMKDALRVALLAPASPTAPVVEAAPAAPATTETPTE